MIVAVARENAPGENRVALIPASVPALVGAGLDVLVERAAGQAAGFPDEQYAQRGAKTGVTRQDVRLADCRLHVQLAGGDPDAARVALEEIRPGQFLIGLCDPLGAPQVVQQVAGRGATLFALELLPRISRAQSMDVLSSMATVAGYRAVLLAAGALPKMFPMLITAAGTVSPAKVFVVGAGVAGLQAIATARRLGAVVSAYDVRPAVKEQVESLGARFLELQLQTAESEDKGGYAKQMDEDFYRRQREMMARVLAETDVVITTAAVPGKRAPVLITGEMVAGMRPGAVIVDLAAEQGGNCELTAVGQTIARQGVTILGPANLPAGVSHHASQMYSKNISTFLLHLVDDGQIKIDLEDEIIRHTLVARRGKVVNPRVCEALGIDPPASPAGEEEKENENEGGDG